MGQTQQAPEAHKQKAGSNTIRARQSRATRLEGATRADQYRAEDTTRREHERVSNMKGRGGARENNTTINTTGQGKGNACVCTKPSYKTGRGRTRGSIQGRQETQRYANASA